MLVADRSDLIECFRRGGSPAVQEAVAAAITEDALAFNGIIFVEVVGFAADEHERQALLASFGAFHRLALDEGDFDLAATIRFDLRRRVRPLAATAPVLAASADRAQAGPLHLAHHLGHIASINPLT